MIGNFGTDLNEFRYYMCLTLKNVESKTTFKDGEK